MAELQVEPKKKSAIWPWLLLALGIIALIVYLSRRNNDTAGVAVGSDSTASIASPSMTDSANPATGTLVTGWEDVDPYGPTLQYPEIRDKNIEVRGNDAYAVYDLKEEVLFDKASSKIRPQAAESLQQVAQSMKQRFNNPMIRLYGFTDAQGSTAFNAQLAEERAESVKQWLTSNAGISADNISVEAVGEVGRQAGDSKAPPNPQNRKVKIAVRNVNAP